MKMRGVPENPITEKSINCDKSVYKEQKKS